MRGNSAVNYLLAVGGGYLIYLGVKLLKTFFTGEASLGFFTIIIGAFFIALGLGVLAREWYHYTHPKKDDEEELELPDDEEFYAGLNEEDELSEDQDEGCEDLGEDER